LFFGCLRRIQKNERKHDQLPVDEGALLNLWSIHPSKQFLTIVHGVYRIVGDRLLLELSGELAKVLKRHPLPLSWHSVRLNTRHQQRGKRLTIQNVVKSRIPFEIVV
jgi:hypothetical protein